MAHPKKAQAIRDIITFLVVAVTLAPALGSAQPNRERRARNLAEGSALVRSAENEYTIRIECEDAARPEIGFTTEANRRTRQATGGRSNMVSLRLRPWKDTDDVLIHLDGVGQAWLPRPSSAGGILSMAVVLRPGSFVRNGTPVLVTYDMWKQGDIPDGEIPIYFEANCSQRDPEAPTFRKLP